MRKDEITLVTAFFDIGRGDLDNESLRRTTGRYMDDFSRWARLKNKMVCRICLYFSPPDLFIVL